MREELEKLINLYIKQNTYKIMNGEFVIPLTDIKIPISELKKILNNDIQK